ncbi:hypothetical protein [Galbitalea soli]|uniref:Uncharacterized protein n=1 Tax=Galbitalea soli TaxID=1268042 RepID=A0A7C9PM91_9MICO|nr:hypothetical protein [Galbitalea soli]NEM90568.1 hypothetical protein [Galbitalea soli]NYJ31284.1 hypothetical protein [Galbitalea soli]
MLPFPPAPHRRVRTSGTSARRVGAVVGCAALLVALSACDAPPRPLHLSSPTPQTTAQRNEALLEEATRVIKAESLAEDRIFAGVDNLDALRPLATPSWFGAVSKELRQFRSAGLITRGVARASAFTLVTMSTRRTGETELRVGYCSDVSDTALLRRDGHPIPRASGSPRASLVTIVVMTVGSPSSTLVDFTSGLEGVNYC